MRCQQCQTQVAKPHPAWRTESFHRQDRFGHRYLVTLSLCPRCTAFVSACLGEPRSVLALRLPPDLVPLTRSPRTARRIA